MQRIGIGPQITHPVEDNLANHPSSTLVSNGNSCHWGLNADDAPGLPYRRAMTKLRRAIRYGLSRPNTEAARQARLLADIFLQERDVNLLIPQRGQLRLVL